MQTRKANPLLSLVIPVYNEAKSLPFLYQEIRQALSTKKYFYEILFIDDGSADNSSGVVQILKKKNKRVRLLTFRTNTGKSEALAAGFQAARGEIIVTLDADLQDDPREIPKLLAKLSRGYDMVSGWRHNRQDTFLKKVSSRLFNIGTMLITGVQLHDINCGLKAFKKDVIRELPLYGELHRYIPVLAAKKKFHVTEVRISHRKRRFGTSKYGWERSWRGILDLMTTVFLTDYASKPAHFFGRIGLLLFTVGFLMDSYVTYIKISTGTTQARIPMLLAGILCMVLGVQLLSTGLIAEMITHYFRRRQVS